jgi:pyrimidine operon attenuation protein / uracil phosphoribosyltransferase
MSAPHAKLPDAEALVSGLAAMIKSDMTPETVLVGIHTGGVWLAERLQSMLGIVTPLGTLDITFYRDDFDERGLHRDAKRSTIPFDVAGKDIVLVDDVLYTGRTIRAAMNELFDYGRPARIRLAVLIDRQSRELPIGAQFIGMTMPVPDDEMLVLERSDNGKLTFKQTKKEVR